MKIQELHCNIAEIIELIVYGAHMYRYELPTSTYATLVVGHVTTQLYRVESESSVLFVGKQIFSELEKGDF